MIMFEFGGPLRAFVAAAGSDTVTDADREARVPPTPISTFVLVDGSDPLVLRGLAFTTEIDERAATFEIWSAPWRKARLPWQ
jgi:hypothetical protein